MATKCSIHNNKDALQYCYECETKLCSECYAIHQHGTHNINHYNLIIRLLVERDSYTHIISAIQLSKATLITRFNQIILSLQTMQLNAHTNALNCMRSVLTQNTNQKLIAISKCTCQYIESDINLKPCLQQLIPAN